jgi:hypothetical protein
MSELIAGIRNSDSKSDVGQRHLYPRLQVRRSLTAALVSLPHEPLVR